VSIHFGTTKGDDVQLTYDEAELLASHDYEEPLIAGGVRCHGGFDADGAYVSPRTKHRGPAIEAWQANHRGTFGTELLGLPLDTWPEHYPNVAQARHLIEAGLPEPIISTLTRIGTVEGFGGMIRLSPVPDRRRTFEEDTDGTALAHLTGGLFEAHARDEAGYDPDGGEPEGGHKQMWFAARDVAFGDPPTEDETQLMLQRMGISQMAKAAPERFWPEDVSVDLELLVERMTRLLLIEISAFHTFAWAEELLDDPDLVAGDGEAARLVAYIRADETPHVEYLKTVLTEVRDRTIVGHGGRRHAGTVLVGRTWDRALADSLGDRRRAIVEIIRGEVAHAAEGRADAADLLARFDELATPEEVAA
jgi:hypothetical protein